MNDTERAELAAAIATHLPGLPAEAVEWREMGARLDVGSMVFTVMRSGPCWLARELTGHPRGDRSDPSPDAILTAVRAHFVTALATARADVAAYERALGGASGCTDCGGRFVVATLGHNGKVVEDYCPVCMGGAK